MKIFTPIAVLGVIITGAFVSVPVVAEGIGQQSFVSSADDIDRAEMCAAKPTGSDCWKALDDQKRCFVWTRGSGDETLTWTGKCKQGIAQGQGTLTYTWPEEHVAGEGKLVNGKQDGYWVWRVSNGIKEEGKYTHGQRIGRWRFTWPDGSTGEGAMLGDDLNGEWIVHLPNGKVETRYYLKGEQQ